MVTERLSQALAVLATIDPVSTSTTANADVIDMLRYERVLFILSFGAIATNGTADFKITGDTVSGGSYATTITGKSITQLTDTDDNKQVLVEVTAAEVAAQGFRYIRGELTCATAASVVSVVALGSIAKYGPASQSNLASVDEIVA